MITGTHVIAVVCLRAGITSNDEKKRNRHEEIRVSLAWCYLSWKRWLSIDCWQSCQMTENDTHLLQEILDKSREKISSRMIQPLCLTERYRRSFLPATVKFHNAHTFRRCKLKEMDLTWSPCSFHLFSDILSHCLSVKVFYYLAFDFCFLLLCWDCFPLR